MFEENLQGPPKIQTQILNAKPSALSPATPDPPHIPTDTKPGRSCNVLYGSYHLALCTGSEPSNLIPLHPSVTLRLPNTLARIQWLILKVLHDLLPWKIVVVSYNKVIQDFLVSTATGLFLCSFPFGSPV